MSQRRCFALPPSCHLPALTFSHEFRIPLPPAASLSPMSPPRWWPVPQHPGHCSWIPTAGTSSELHLLEIIVLRIFLLLGNGLCRAGLAGGQHPNCTAWGGTRAPGRWLLFKPGPLFCSSPLCAWRGFCCSLKRLNSGCICRWVRKCSADALGKGGCVGLGVPSIPGGQGPRWEPRAGDVAAHGAPRVAQPLWASEAPVRWGSL